MEFYQDDNGDYLAVNLDTREARAAAIAGLASSVQTVSVSESFLEDHCKPVEREQVPADWLTYIGV